MKAHFYIGETLIESFDFDRENIGPLKTEELPKFSSITKSGSYIESIIWHMLEFDLMNWAFDEDAYNTDDKLSVYLSEKDLFDDLNSLPIQVQELIKEFNDDEAQTYKRCKDLSEDLAPYGYNFAFDIHGNSSDLHKTKPWNFQYKDKTGRGFVSELTTLDLIVLDQDEIIEFALNASIGDSFDERLMRLVRIE